MEHLLIIEDSTTSSSSPSRLKEASDGDTYEIPSPTYVSSLPPAPKEVPRQEPTQLHNEISNFSKMLEMSSQEIKRKKELIQIVTDVCWKIFKKKFRQLKVEPFGGFVNGLGTKRSDIDIVLTGMFSPDGGKQGGYLETTKKLVSACLSDILYKLNLPMRNKQLIRNARIPILKLTTEDHIDVDISIGNHGGPQAAMFIKSQVDAYPVVRPVVITAKYLLQAYELNDVSTSGLGSYSLANMVIAYVRNLEQKGESLTDYGKVFLGFLDYFANQFDIRNEAISLRKGAFCHKSEVLKLGEHPGRYRFCIEDYFSGHDVSGGTCKVDAIVALFGRVFQSLEKHKNSPPVTQRDSMFPLLSKFIDVHSPFATTQRYDDSSSVERSSKRRRRSVSPKRNDSRGSRSERSRTKREPSHRREDESRVGIRRRMDDLHRSGNLPPHVQQERRKVSLSNVLSTVIIKPRNRVD